MNTTWVARRSLAMNKWLVLVLLASLQMACSRGSENILIYDGDSNSNSPGPSSPQTAPHRDPHDITNYIINGGVESELDPMDPMSWSRQGNAASIKISQSSAQARSGSYSLLVTGREQNWHGPRKDLPRGLPLGEDYLVTAWVRLAEDTPESTITATIKRQTGNTDQYLFVASAEVPVGKWVMLAGIYTHEVPADGGGDFYIYLESPNATASFYVDDLALRKINLAINGGVEEGTEGWARFGDQSVISQVSAPVRSGDYSLSVTERTASWQGASFSFAHLDADATYGFSCWVRLADDYANNSVILSIKLGDAAEQDKFFNLDAKPASSEEWVQVSGDYTHRPKGAVKELIAYIQAGSDTAEFLIDDCSVRFVSAPAEGVSGFLPLPPPPSEWIANGGVEDGVEPWGKVHEEISIGQSSAQARSGEYSLLVTNRSEGWHGPTMALPLTLSRGDNYLASVWVRLAEGTERSVVKLSLKRGVDGKDEFFTLAEGDASGQDWIRLRGVYNHDLADDAELEEFFLYIESPNATADYYLDDLTFQPNKAH